jgi:adenylate cyclase
VERRLSAILVSDIVGYSRLMEIDERGTIQAQKTHRDELFDPEIEAHGGRIFKTTGDGLLAEFPSVVEAVECAVAIQRAMVERDTQTPKDQRIQYRIGINLGDVIHEDGDLHGDGVNIAARLEQMADPGGICLSGAAYEHLRTTVEIGYEDLGEVQVKNIARPIQAWRVLLDAEQIGQVIAAPTTGRGSLPRLLGAIGLLMVAIAATFWWVQRPEFTPADPENYAFALPEKPSIAVLAFDNLSGDLANEHISDGLSENIIATLADSPKLFVIARNSSFHYKGNATPVQTIAEELGVRYILEGSVQRSGENIRATAQLIDALDGRHIWANTYDRALSAADMFTIQDEITGDIATSLNVELVSGDAARNDFEDVGDLETLALVQQAIAEFQKFTPAGNKLCEDLLLKALETKPDSWLIHLNLGWATWYKVPLGQSANPAATFAKAREYAERTMEIDPDNAYGFALLGWIDMYELQHESALKNAAKAVEFSPSGGIATSVAGWVFSSSGQPARGAELLRFGMRTEPFYPDWIPNSLASSLMMLGQLDEAKELLLVLEAGANRSIQQWSRTSLTIIAVWQNDIELAQQYTAKSLLANSQTSIAMHRRLNYNNRDQAYLERLHKALRIAGWPENPPSPSKTND